LPAWVSALQKPHWAALCCLLVITALLVPTGIFWQNVILPTICNVSCDDRGNIAPVSFDTEHVSAVETLSQLKSLKVLRYLFDLDLSGTTITDAELVHLNGIPNLTCLNLQETTITDAGVTELQKALPNCYIFH